MNSGNSEEVVFSMATHRRGWRGQVHEFICYGITAGKPHPDVREVTGRNFRKED
jgi:hypothetical protein